MPDLPRECRTYQGIPKTKFTSEVDAQNAMLLKVGTHKGWRRRLLKIWSVYVCGHCGYMHIGRMPRRARFERHEKVKAAAVGGA